MNASSQVSTASSFYEAPEIYDEEKTRMLYKKLKSVRLYIFLQEIIFIKNSKFNY